MPHAKISQPEGAATIDLLNTENNQEAPINCRLPEKLLINEDDFLEGVTEEQIVEHLQGSLNWLCEFSEHINSYSSLEQFDSLEDAVEGVQVNSDTVVEYFKQTDTFILSNRNSKPPRYNIIPMKTHPFLEKKYIIHNMHIEYDKPL